MRFLELDIAGLRAASINLCKLISDDYKPDLVVYLARGGYFIGADVATYFGCQMAELDRHREEFIQKKPGLLQGLPHWLKHFLRTIEFYLRGNGNEYSDLDSIEPARFTSRYEWPAAPNCILLVDDSIDSGASIAAALKALKGKYPGAEVKVAVLNTFIPSSKKVPFDWALMTNTLISTPSSKDNPYYQEFCKLYESNGYRND